MSKITVAGVRTNVQSLLEYSLNEKKRNFLYVTPSPNACACLWDPVSGLSTVLLTIAKTNLYSQGDCRASSRCPYRLLPSPNADV